MEWRKILILVIVAPLVANIAWLLICALVAIIWNLFSGFWGWIKSKSKIIKSSKSELIDKIRKQEDEIIKLEVDKQELETKLEKSKDIIQKLEDENEWSNAIIDDYTGYTWIYPREISEKSEKRNKRKKRK